MTLEPTGVSLVTEGFDAFVKNMGAAGQSVVDFGGAATSVAGGALKGFATAAGGVALVVGGALVAGLGGAAVAGFGFNNSMEQARAKINAFTKDAGATTEILEMVKERASQTPFAFEEMAGAAASLGPAAKSAGIPLEELIAQAEILAASNPAEGLEGAAFAIKEALSGDFASAIERFNLSRSYINDLREQGVPDLEALGMAMQQAGYDASLVTELANTASGRLSTFTDTFTNLAGTVTQPIFDAFSAGLGVVNEELAAGTPTMEAAAAALGEALVPAAQWLGETMANTAAGLVAFIDGVTNADGSFRSFGELWATFGPIIQTAATDALARVGEFAVGIGQALLEGLPGVVANLQAIGQQLLGWAQEQAPGWLAGLQTLGAALGQWVTDNLPTMLGSLMEARNQLIAWVLDSLPGWAGELAKLGAALGQWVIDALPGLGTGLGAVAAELLKGTGNLIAIAVPKLLELGGQFVTWVATEVLPKLPGQLVAVGGVLLTGIGNFIAQVTPELIRLGGMFINWVGTEVLPKAPGELAKIGGAIVSGINGFIGNVQAEAAKIGKAIIDGIVNAVKSGAGAIASAVGQAATNALNEAKRLLGIKSPSLVFANEVGAPIVAGMAQGMLGNLQVLLDAAKDISWAVLDEAKAFAKTIEGAMGPLLASAFQGAADFARGQIGALDALDSLRPDNSVLEKWGKATQDALDNLDKLPSEFADKRDQLQAEIDKLEQGVARDDTAALRARLEDELRALEQDKRDSAKDLADQRARLAYTAANNYDPEVRAKAAADLAELDRDAGAATDPAELARIAAIKQQLADLDKAGAAETAAAREAELARIVALKQELAGLADVEAQRRAELQAELNLSAEAYAAEEKRYAAQQAIREQAEQDIAAAQAEALKLQDPAERAAFLKLRTSQIIEMAQLEQRIAGETNDYERARLEERKKLLIQAQQADAQAYAADAQARRADQAAALRDAEDAIKQLTNLIHFSQVDANGVGSDLIRGIGAGMLTQLTALSGTLDGAMQGVLDGLEKALGINSPSRLFADEIGGPMAAGIVAGFQEELLRAGPAITASVQAIVTPVQRATAGVVGPSYTDNRSVSISAPGATAQTVTQIRRVAEGVIRQQTTRSDLIRRTR